MTAFEIFILTIVQFYNVYKLYNLKYPHVTEIVCPLLITSFKKVRIVDLKNAFSFTGNLTYFKSKKKKVLSILTKNYSLIATTKLNIYYELHDVNNFTKLSTMAAALLTVIFT